jgi:hypothetical protein
MVRLASRLVKGEIKEDELYKERDLIVKGIKAPRRCSVEPDSSTQRQPKQELIF